MITLPKDDLQKQELLKKVVAKFEKGKKYNGMQVNDVIKYFNFDDHVLVRRELINFGYLQRNPYTDIYWVLTFELSKEELNKIKLRSKKIKQIEKEI
jgi:hypothetical protein